MDGFGLSPLFRSTIGFDRLARLVDAAARVDKRGLCLPPYSKGAPFQSSSLADNLAELGSAR